MSRSQQELNNALLRANTPESIKLLLEAGADAKVVDNYGQTVLFGQDNHECIKLLLEAGADAKVVDNYWQTALFYPRNPKSIQLLLEAGVDATVIDGDGRTALFHQNNTECIKVLLAAGADPTVVDCFGQTMLFGQKDPESIRLLLEAGVDLTVVSNGGDTALFDQKNPESIQLLLEAGADATVVDNYGLTVLFYPRNPKSLQLLLAAGADPTVVDNDGRTALFGKGNPESVRLLLAAGVDPTVVDNDGRTAKSDIPNPQAAQLLKFAEDIYNTEKGLKTIDPTKYLKEAIVYGVPILCAKLIELGADITDFVSYAIEHTSSYEVFEFLLTKSLQGLDSEQRAEKIADLVEEVDPDTGTTQLMECISSLTRFSSKEAWVARTKVAIKLIELGADVNAVSHAGFHALQLLAEAFTVAKSLDNPTVVLKELKDIIIDHIDVELLSANIAEVDPDTEVAALQSEINEFIMNMKIGEGEGEASAAAEEAMSVAEEDIDPILLISAAAPASGMASSECESIVDVAGAADTNMTGEESA